MSPQETAAARQQAAIAQRAKVQAIASGISGATSAVMAGMKYGAFDSLGGGQEASRQITQLPTQMDPSIFEQQTPSLPSIGISSISYDQNPMQIQYPNSILQEPGGVAPIGGTSFDEPTIEELLNTGGYLWQ